MTEDKQDNMYELKVVKQKYIPNKDNPSKIELTCEAEIQGVTKRKSLTFSPRQVADGRWEKHFITWLEQEEGEKKQDVPDLENERIKNTGTDGTGPERNYPERKGDPEIVDD